jgi:hypothetical protein
MVRRASARAVEALDDAREFGQAVIDVHRRLTVGLFGVIRATTGSSVAFG